MIFEQKKEEYENKKKQREVKIKTMTEDLENTKQKL